MSGKFDGVPALWRATLCGTALIMSAASVTARADETPVLPEVVVTGSHIKTTDQGALPVQTITQEQIQRSGATTPEQFLQSVSVAVQGNSNLVAASGAGATTGGVSSVSLRGLGSQRTLVLVNGRRVAGGGTITDSVTVDVNSIPLSALERVDVLKDGASAIYGSDAIAGVVNFVIRDNYRGAELTGYGGGTSDGGATQRHVNGLVGFGNLTDDRYNVLLTGSFQKEAPLYGFQRSFSASGINVAANNDVTTGHTFPANVLATDGSFGTTNPLVGNCAPSVTDPLIDPQGRCRYDPSPHVALLPASERYSLFSAAHYALTGNVQLYAEASYNHNRQRFIIQPVPLSSVFPLPANNPLFNQFPYNSQCVAPCGLSTILLQPSSPYYPTAFVASLTGDPNHLPALDVYYRSLITGNRDLTDISEQPRVVVGTKGRAGGWDFDTSLLYSQTRLIEHVNNGYPAQSLLLPLLNSGQVNFFGPSSAAVQAQADATQFRGDAYKTRTSLAEISAYLSRELWKLPAGAFAFAVGAEVRKEKFATDPNPTIQTGDIAGYGGNYFPQDVQRNVYGVSAELSVPILKSLSAGAAVRYDEYQGTGSKTTPKVNLRWKPLEQLLARASYGRGFRAPSLTELFQPPSLGTTAASLNDPVRCGTTHSTTDCVTQFNTLIGGNTRLSPEESDNITLGFVVEPTSNFSVGVDGFSIKLKNTIIFGVPPTTILADPATYGFLLTRGPPTANCPGCPGPITQIDQTNSNFGETKLAGYDVDVRLRFPTAGVGTFTLGLVGSYFARYQIQNPDFSFSNIAGRVSPITNGNGGVVPRWHHYVTGTWTRGPVDLSVSQNFQSSYADLVASGDDPTLPGYPQHPHEVASYSTIDLQGAYSGFTNTRVAVGLRNAFNKNPPYTNAGGSNYFQAGYDPGYADPRGRFIYGTVTYSFGPK
jgi:iron complex outermembrane receptor protein